MSDDPPNDVNIDKYDTPTERVTINQLNVDELDAWLEQIRERRLQRVRKLEAVAKLRADEVRLEAFMRYEKQYAKAKAALLKIEEMETKAEAIIHKLRVLALTAQLEVEDA